MPWIVKDKKKCLHHSRPELSEDFIDWSGRIWECESCGKQFKVVRKQVERYFQYGTKMVSVVEWKEGKYV